MVISQEMKQNHAGLLGAVQRSLGLLHLTAPPRSVPLPSLAHPSRGSQAEPPPVPSTPCPLELLCLESSEELAEGFVFVWKLQFVLPHPQTPSTRSQPKMLGKEQRSCTAEGSRPCFASPNPHSSSPRPPNLPSLASCWRAPALLPFQNVQPPTSWRQQN